MYETTEFLEMFFENLLLNKHHELKNRYMHLDYRKGNSVQSAKNESPKCQNGTLGFDARRNGTFEYSQSRTTITQKGIAELSGKSERTIKRRTIELQEKGYICRENGKRNGKWTILIDM